MATLHPYLNFEGNTVKRPLGKVFCGALFEMLTDRFGIQWMISCQEKP